MAEGLGFDRCLVAVVTAIDEGVRLDLAEGDAPEKKVLVYRAATDVVLPEGALVLRAGEPLGPIVARHCRGALVLFSADEHESTLATHIAGGGKAVFARGDRIVLSHGSNETALPAPRCDDSSETILAAIAAAWVLSVPPSQLIVGLTSWRANPRDR